MKNLTKSIFFIYCFFVLINNSSCANNKEAVKRGEAIEKFHIELDAFMNHIQSLENKVKVDIKKNPDSVSKDLLLPLQNVKVKTEEIQGESKTLVSRNDNDAFEICKRLHNEIVNILAPQVFAIEKVHESILNKVLRSDVSFVTGRYDLKEEGKSELEEIVNETETLISGWDDFDNSRYKNKQKIITVNIVGYADLQGSSNVEERQANNLLLSENRANSVEEYLRSKFDSFKVSYDLTINIASEGRGEELPPNVFDTISINNPQRRICSISISVRPVFE